MEKFNPIRDRCAKCGQDFDSWSWYNRHVSADSCFAQARILPTRTTTRTRAEIIRDMEETFGPHLIDGASWNEPRRHTSTCRCLKCFDAYYDSLKKGELSHD